MAVVQALGAFGTRMVCLKLVPVLPLSTWAGSAERFPHLRIRRLAVHVADYICSTQKV
jgi:hypothetical protein